LLSQVIPEMTRKPNISANSFGGQICRKNDMKLAPKK